MVVHYEILLLKLLDTLNTDHYRTLMHGANNLFEHWVVVKQSLVFNHHNPIKWAAALHSQRALTGIQTDTIMANRNRANPFSISSLLDKKDEEKPQEKCADVQEEACQENSDDECTKDEKRSLERIPSITEDSKTHRIHSWFTEYQGRQTSDEASECHFHHYIVTLHFKHH